MTTTPLYLYYDKHSQEIDHAFVQQLYSWGRLSERNSPEVFWAFVRDFMEAQAQILHGG
jgi:hypothetical protein